MATPNAYNQIVLFGDSITQFSFDPMITGFGALLAHAYNRKLDVLNRGFSGYNTDWAITLLKQILPTVKQQKEQACSISLMTIFFGANDASLPFHPQHVPLDRYKSNTKAMIDLVRNPESPYYNPTMKLILITPPPINEVQWAQNCEGKLNRTNECARIYADCIKEIGRETNVIVADIWTEIMDQEDQVGLAHFFLDGLHLNGNGYQLLYHRLISIITEHHPELHPETVKYEIPYYRDLLVHVPSENYCADYLQFPLLLKNKPTTGN